MLFKKEMIEQILSGKKTMTRRIVKEGEEFLSNSTGKLKGRYFKGDEVYLFRQMRTKWQVGRRYAVCPGRGKPQFKYYGKEIARWSNGTHARELIPLFIELVSIRREKLLDISEEDAKREGFLNTKRVICGDDCVELSARQNFIDKFCEINKIGFREDGIPNKNPDVWVLEFKVV